MKQEDIDKKIGMPDVDAEWTHFEREVIGANKPRFRHAITWAVGIAAAVLLLFVLNTDMERDTEMPVVVQQVALNSHQDDDPTSYQDDNVMRLGSTEEDSLSISHSKSIFNQDNEQVQKRTAQLPIVPTTADLGPGYTMQLGGNSSDKDSVLVVIDGKPISISVNLLSTATKENLEQYFKTSIESIIIYKDEDNKLQYVHKYGELAQNGVIDIKTKSDAQAISDIHGSIAGLDNTQRTESQVSDIKIIGTDSVGALKFLTNYSEGKKLAEHLLIPIDSASKSWQEQHKRMAFYDKLRLRFMMPKHVAFGMGCEPSQLNEWSLYYDSVAHALIYTKAEKNIYWATRDALYKEKKIGKDRYQRVLRRHPKRIRKLKVKSYSMPITNEQAQRLKTMWTESVGCTETKKAFALDGTKIEFPFGTLRSKTPNGENPLVTFTNELAEAVYANDVHYKDSLLAEATLKRYLADTKEAMKPVQFNYNSFIIVANKQQLPDSLCKLIRYKVRQYYHRQRMMVATRQDWSAYGAKYHSGYDKNCPLMELTVVPDTLSDAYVSQHPEMQQALRHVSGIVMDENNHPLADVWVGIRGAGAGAPTDTAGNFSFWMPRQEKFLYAECLGYISLSNIPADSSLTIRLRSATVRLK